MASQNANLDLIIVWKLSINIRQMASQNANLDLIIVWKLSISKWKKTKHSVSKYYDNIRLLFYLFT